MKRTKLRKKGKSDTAQAKDRIQKLAREIVIARDGGCILRGVAGITPCNGFAQDGHLVLQADHLITRSKNIGYADTRVIVCLCKGHHTARTYDKSGYYDELIRKQIGKERGELWDRMRTDHKTYPMGLQDWLKIEVALTQELKDIA